MNGDTKAGPRSVARLGAAALRARWLVRAPIWLYRAHLGIVFGRRLLMLTPAASPAAATTSSWKSSTTANAAAMWLWPGSEARRSGCAMCRPIGMYVSMCPAARRPPRSRGAALGTVGNMAYCLPGDFAGEFGRPDLNAAILTARRDAFLAAALDQLDS
jgi:hypothetical protein